MMRRQWNWPVFWRGFWDGLALIPLWRWLGLLK